MNSFADLFRGKSFAAWVLASPAIIGMLLFIAIPFAIAIGLSFTNMRMGSPLPTEFVGFQQYERIFADPAFRRALFNNAVFAGVIVPLQTVLALVLALVLNMKLPGRLLFRTLFFMPVIFPMALVAVVWQLIFAPGPDALMNSVLHTLTFGQWEPRDYLRDPALALPAIMVMSLWQGVGFQMVILLAGRQNVPEHLYEAASIDGANPWQKFLYVTLPQMRNPLLFVIVVTTILAFRLFDQVEILTRGGPDRATTTVMFEAVKSAFERQQIGRGSAITVVFFLIVVSVALLQRKILREEREVN